MARHVAASRRSFCSRQQLVLTLLKFKREQEFLGSCYNSTTAASIQLRLLFITRGKSMAVLGTNLDKYHQTTSSIISESINNLCFSNVKRIINVLYHYFCRRHHYLIIVRPVNDPDEMIPIPSLHYSPELV